MIFFKKSSSPGDGVILYGNIFQKVLENFLKKKIRLLQRHRQKFLRDGAKSPFLINFAQSQNEKQDFEKCICQFSPETKPNKKFFSTIV